MLVTTVFAKDLDEGNNAEVTYSASSGKSHYHKGLRVFEFPFLPTNNLYFSGKTVNIEDNIKYETHWLLSRITFISKKGI